MANRPSSRALVTVGLGGAVGTLLRFGVYTVSDGAPAGTLVVNLAGAALLGVLVGCARWTPGQSAFLLTGLLGGFTTYSALVLDALSLSAGVAAAYGAATIIGGVTLALGGICLGRRWRSHPAAPARGGDVLP